MAHKVFLKAKNIATLCILESPEKIRAKELTAMITTMSCQSLSVMTRSPSTIGLILNSKGAIGLQVTSWIKIFAYLSSHWSLSWMKGTSASTKLVLISWKTGLIVSLNTQKISIKSLIVLTHNSRLIQNLNLVETTATSSTNGLTNTKICMNVFNSKDLRRLLLSVIWKLSTKFLLKPMVYRDRLWILNWKRFLTPNGSAKSHSSSLTHQALWCNGIALKTAQNNQILLKKMTAPLKKSSFSMTRPKWALPHYSYKTQVISLWFNKPTRLVVVLDSNIQNRMQIKLLISSLATIFLAHKTLNGISMESSSTSRTLKKIFLPSKL